MSTYSISDNRFNIFYYVGKCIPSFYYIYDDAGVNELKGSSKSFLIIVSILFTFWIVYSNNLLNTMLF